MQLVTPSRLPDIHDGSTIVIYTSICAPEHPPKAPRPGFNTDDPPSLGHTSNPDADEHSQTQPSLRNEPTAKVISGRIKGFFSHVLMQDITAANEANLDLSDLKYPTAASRGVVGG